MSANRNERPGGCLAAFLGLFRSTPTASTAEPLPYRVRADFLSPAELAFYQVVRLVVGDGAVICPKVRLPDVFFVANSQERQKHWNGIAQKHLDFLVCASQTMQPLLGIELDDKSHTRQDRIERDAFVDAVFEAANLPLIHIPTRLSYNVQDLSTLIMPHINNGASTPIKPAPVTAEDVANGMRPTCPNCKTPMVLRTSSRGQHQGKQFYGCTNYPQCRSTLPIA